MARPFLFNSLHCDRSEGRAYVHAMVRVQMAEMTLRAEVTIEADDLENLPADRDLLHAWVNEKLSRAFGGANPEP